MTNVPKPFRNLLLATSPVRKEQAETYRRLMDSYMPTFMSQLESDAERIHSVYLFSREPGTGKTTTAIALLNEWLIAHYVSSIQRGQRPLERPAYFFDMNEWQELYNKFNRSRVPEDVAEPAAREYERRMQIGCEVPFLVVDDIGVRSCTEAFRGDVHTLINARLKKQLPTVYTSNIPLEGLANVYDTRIVDRIRDRCIPIRFIGESKRGVRKRG